MSKSVAVPDEIYARVAELAEADKVSIGDFISGGLADQLAARDYLRRRGARASREKFLAALDQVPDVESEEYDRF
jgi:hypothetical protein